MSTVTGTGRVVDRSGHVGTGTATCEVGSYDLVVNPGQNALTLVNGQPAGTSTQRRRILVNGTHRLTSHLAVKAYTDLVVNGMLVGDIPLTGWVLDGTNRWSVSGKLPQAYTEAAGVKPEHTTGPFAGNCLWREDVFVNGVILTRVTTSSAVAPGTFFADYTTNKVYIGQDPAGKTIEMSRAAYAVKTTAPGVRLLGAGVVRRFATPAQMGAVSLEGPECLVDGWNIKWVHAAGLKLYNSHGTIVRNTLIDDCGQIGYSNATSHDVRWESCRFRRNNNAGFLVPDWESGGGKTSRSRGVVFWDCWSQDNKGIGFWDDIDVDGTVYSWCRSERNDSCGLRLEISRNQKIDHCQVYDNGLYHRPDSGSESTGGRDPGMFATDGINIHNSGGRDGGQLRVSNCDLFGNRNGIGVQQRNRSNPDWLVKNVLVENCRVRSAILTNPATGQRWADANGNPISSISGIGALSQTATRSGEIYDVDVEFRNNQYASTERIMRWTGSSWVTGTLAQSQAAGQEVGSVISSAF